MRRTLSMIICVVMLISACVFAIPASAAEGTAINSADEFMNMSAEGTYYLNADITLPGTYTAAFKGTLDGNGKTLTVSAPVFADFSGSVKNLTINGKITASDENVASFAVLSSNGIKAENVTSNVVIIATGNTSLVAGLVAEDKATQTNANNPASEYVGCVNNGELYVDSTAAKNPTVAGIVARVDSVIFKNCENNAKITCKGNLAVAAGIAANLSPVAGTNILEAYNCVNNGDITCLENYADSTGAASTGASETAGLFANIGVKNNIGGGYRVWGCVNNGDIVGTYRVSGLVGYCYGSGVNQYIDIQFCINTGDLTYGRTASTDDNVHDWCSPFVAYTNTSFTTVKYNIDLGTYTKDANAITKNPAMCFIGCSTANVKDCDVQYNYLVNQAAFEYYTYASADKNAAQRLLISETTGVLAVTHDELKSGKIAYTINEATKEDAALAADGFAFYQTIGTDELPSIDASRGWVVLNGTTYANGDKTSDATTAPEETTAAPEAGDETTQAPEAGDATTEAPATDAPTTGAPTTDKAEEKKGCGGFVAGGVAIFALAGTAIVFKKRH